MMPSKKRFSIGLVTLSVVALVLIILLSACSERPRPLTILYTNDMHAHFLPWPALRDKPPLGGFAALDYYVTLERKKDPRALLFDSGDLMTGNLICNIRFNDAEGGALIEMMNMIGYDGMVFGNHELDKPIGNLRRFTEIADFPIFCANFIDSTGKDFTKEKYHIYNVGGLKVGVIGVTYHKMAGMANPDNLDGYDSTDPLQAINQVLPELDPKSDLIVVLSHLGIEADRELAQKISGVDIILGGHSHTRLDKAEKINGVLICQTGSHVRNLGKLSLKVAGDSIYSYHDTLIPMTAENIKADSALTSLIDSMAAIIDEEFGAVIGTLASDWETAYQAESNIGNWITDMLRAKTGADIAIVNSGGIRKRIPAGQIILRDVYEMLPFDNYVSFFECSGEDLKTIFEANADAEAGERSFGSLQISGASYVYEMKDGRPIISEMKVGGKPINPSKTYRIATIDYVISNADKYLKITPKNVTESNQLLSDLIVQCIKEVGTIDSKVEGRIKRKG